MATRDPNSAKRAIASAILAMSLLITPAFATSWRVHEALKDTNMLFTATLALSLDLGRAPMVAEWPDILVSAPSSDATWHGPYTRDSLLDAWGQPFALRVGIDGPETFGVYSVGRDGIDAGGAGDDVSSWAGFDRRFYSFREPGDWFVLFVVPLISFVPIAWLGFHACKRLVVWVRRF